MEIVVVIGPVATVTETVTLLYVMYVARLVLVEVTVERIVVRNVVDRLVTF